MSFDVKNRIKRPGKIDYRGVFLAAVFCIPSVYAGKFCVDAYQSNEAEQKEIISVRLAGAWIRAYS